MTSFRLIKLISASKCSLTDIIKIKVDKEKKTQPSNLYNYCFPFNVSQLFKQQISANKLEDFQDSEPDFFFLFSHFTLFRDYTSYS